MGGCAGMGRWARRREGRRHILWWCGRVSLQSKHVCTGGRSRLGAAARGHVSHPETSEAPGWQEIATAQGCLTLPIKGKLCQTPWGSPSQLSVTRGHPPLGEKRPIHRVPAAQHFGHPCLPKGRPCCYGSTCLKFQKMERGSATPCPRVLGTPVELSPPGLAPTFPWT